jgi:peroxiredoxin
MKVKLFAVLALVMLGIAGFLVYSHKPLAPDVAFSTLQGQNFRTADLRGKVVLVNFWATTCATCIKEMPGLKDTHDKFRPRGFETVAVAMDYDLPARVKAYAERSGLPFTIALDTRGEVAMAFEDVRLTPTSYILDRRGRVVRKILGEPDFNTLHALIERLLAESA